MSHCLRAFSYHVLGQASLATFILGVIGVLLYFGLIAFQWRVRRKLRQNQTLPIHDSLLIPTYIWILWTFGFSIVYFCVANAVVDIDELLGGKASWVSSVVFSIGYCINHFVQDGLAFFLCQKGGGTAALKRASLRGLFIGVVVGTINMLLYTSNLWADGDELIVGIVVTVTINVPFIVMYALMLFLPETTLYRRPAMKYYARFWLLYYAFLCFSFILVYADVDAGFCVLLVVVYGIFGLLKPFIVFETLRLDSNFWCGTMSTKEESEVDDDDARRPLLGTSLEPEIAASLAQNLDNVTSSCRFIHFGEIPLEGGKKSLSEINVLGAGGTARVFGGTYRQKPVAVKMLYCVEFALETIDNYIRETQMLARLRHPNIVHFLGICVVPPCIALVLERCSGSLFEVLRSDYGRRMDWETRLFFMADCARAVACLHAQNPPILHRDLKSANFLVGHDSIPYWTDMDAKQWLICEGLEVFSGCFSGTNFTAPLSAEMIKRKVGSLSSHESFPKLLEKINELQHVANRPMKHIVKLTDFELSKEQTSPTVNAAKQAYTAPETLNWMAPEVIQYGKQNCYTTLSDCYSLGMVLWEIATCCVPFDEPGIDQRTVDMQDLVCRQQRRPPIGASMEPEFVTLLQRCWNADPAQRPSADEIKGELVFLRRRENLSQTLASGTLERDESGGVCRAFLFFSCIIVCQSCAATEISEKECRRVRVSKDFSQRSAPLTDDERAATSTVPNRRRSLFTPTAVPATRPDVLRRQSTVGHVRNHSAEGGSRIDRLRRDSDTQGSSDSVGNASTGSDGAMPMRRLSGHRRSNSGSLKPHELLQLTVEALAAPHTEYHRAGGVSRIPTRSLTPSTRPNSTTSSQQSELTRSQATLSSQVSLERIGTDQNANDESAI